MPVMHHWGGSVTRKMLCCTELVGDSLQLITNEAKVMSLGSFPGQLFELFEMQIYNLKLFVIYFSYLKLEIL